MHKNRLYLSVDKNNSSVAEKQGNQCRISGKEDNVYLLTKIEHSLLMMQLQVRDKAKKTADVTCAEI